MTIAVSPAITLEAFLKLPETKPASEYIDGKIAQKPMPKGRHSRLQGKLGAAINQVTEDAQIAYAFPELRCTFGGRSIVPDLAVFQWQQIPFTDDGEVPDNFAIAPAWTIEILSPEQKPNKVIGNILHCLEFGCQVGWFLDPGDRSLLLFQPNQQPKLLQGNDRLPVPTWIALELTANQVFGWLKMAAE
ncbi:MAG: Uma2 family endonuclease [Stenomitos frigidus ULC029]